MEVILAHAARNLLIAEHAEEEPRRAQRRLTGSSLFGGIPVYISVLEIFAWSSL